MPRMPVTIPFKVLKYFSCGKINSFCFLACGQEISNWKNGKVLYACLDSCNCTSQDIQIKCTHNSRITSVELLIQIFPRRISVKLFSTKFLARKICAKSTQTKQNDSHNCWKHWIWISSKSVGPQIFKDLSLENWYMKNEQKLVTEGEVWSFSNIFCFYTKWVKALSHIWC